MHIEVGVYVKNTVMREKIRKIIDKKHVRMEQERHKYKTHQNPKQKPIDQFPAVRIEFYGFKYDHVPLKH